MARKDFPEDEPATPARGGSVRAHVDDLGGSAGADPIGARLLDLEPDQESPFLRAQKRVPVRRALPRKAATRLKYVLFALGALAVLGVSASAIVRYGRNSFRFRLESSDQVQIEGNRHVVRAQVIGIFGADISRSAFLIPLDERKRQLERIPWIESATVMRVFPSTLRVAVRERTPVAFARIDSRILLIDSHGVLLDYSPAGPDHYSFPVLVGMSASEPLTTRAARMRIYEAVVRDLDSSGANYSRGISEIDLSDPQDVKVLTDDPQGGVIVHLGSENYLDRYKIYMTHVEAWRQQYHKLASVDPRYEGQVVVNPDLSAALATPRATPNPPRGTAPAPERPAAPTVRKHALPKHPARTPTVKHRR